MKKLVVFLSIVLVAIACKKEKCTDTYTISGRLFHDQNSVFEKDEPLKNRLVEFSSMTSKKSLFSKDEMINLGSVYTDDYGYFSISYKCITIDAHVEMEISSNSQYVPGISYVLPKNQDIHRDFTQTSHARIVCEIDNQSDLDTIYIEGYAGNIFDSGSVQGIHKDKYLAVPIKGVSKVNIGYTQALSENLTELKNRQTRVSFGVSYEALDNKDYLGTVSIQCQGAPYYDTVRIELK